MGDPAVRVGFVCVQNAGRSQMAMAFAEREIERRGLGAAVEVRTGGTRPAERVHEPVVTVMQEVGIDLADRTPREIPTEELESCDIVATMGCSTLDLDAAAAGVEVRDWALPDPDDAPLEVVRDIRDDVGARVAALFDELEADVATDA